MKSFFDIVVILLLILAVFTHLVRLVNLFLRHKIFSKFKFLSRPNLRRSELALYYLLVIIVCVYAVSSKVPNIKIW